MAEPLKVAVPSKLKLSELGSRIKRLMILVAEYEQAIARLGDTIEDECMSYIKARCQYYQTKLRADEKRYMTTAGRPHIERVPEDSHVPVVSIPELSQVMSTEAEALGDVTTIGLSLVQLTTNRAALEQELQNIRQAKERMQTEPIKSIDAVEDDNEIQDLNNIIEEYGNKIQEHESWIISLRSKALAAIKAANRAAKSDIEMPGIGRWSPIPAPGTMTTTPLSAPTIATTAPTAADTTSITVTTAQVEVADIPSEVTTAAKDLQASTTSDVVATVPRSTTATIKVDKTLSSITLCAPKKQYANVESVEQTEFAIGDIGWFPILRPSLSESSSDIHTEFGYICAKSYPLIVVEMLEDFNMDFLGNTSHLDYKPISPVWPTVVPEDMKHVQSMIANEALAIELEQARMRLLIPQYSKMMWDGACLGELSHKETELKGASTNLRSRVQNYEAYVAGWNNTVGSVEQKGEKRKRAAEEGGSDERSPPRATKAKTSEMNTMSDPPRFEESSSAIPRPIVQNRYKSVRNVDPKTISVGDIGWAPLPRMALSSSTNKTIPSEYGKVSIKVYPFIIVKKLDDCMLGVVISTAGGQGLKTKSASVRQRSCYVTGPNFKGFDDPPFGWAMSPRCQNLVVVGTGYEPAPGAFVDMLDSHKIYYNSRFEKSGCLTIQSRVDLGRMRLSALLWGASEG
ncbi:unnamed protein product [Alternaria alternata]